MQRHSLNRTICSIVIAWVVVVFACVWSSGVTSAQDETKEFNAAILKYLALQKKAVATVPPIGKDVTDASVIANHEKQVADAIRAQRPDAKIGDIFTLDARRMITAAVKQKVEGKEGVDARATILGEGNPKAPDSPTPVDLSVNAPYPVKAPVSTVPPSVLMALPTLPKGVEFRFVGRNLILLDTQANLIVDVLPNVF
jgi:hypothetical protein